MPSHLYLMSMQQLISCLLGSTCAVQAFHHPLPLSLHFLMWDFWDNKMVFCSFCSPPQWCFRFHQHLGGGYTFLGLKQNLLWYCSFSLISVCFNCLSKNSKHYEYLPICEISFKLECGEVVLLLTAKVVCLLWPQKWILLLVLLWPMICSCLLYPGVSLHLPPPPSVSAAAVPGALCAFTSGPSCVYIVKASREIGSWNKEVSLVLS